MSNPNPGPIRPPTNNPKFNVLVIYGMVAVVVGVLLVLQLPGYAKIAGALPVVLGLWLLTKAVRSGTEPPSAGTQASDQRNADPS